MATTDFFRRSVLSNGVRVVSSHRAGTALAAVKLFFKVGSRHDASHPGIAHFQEHVLFDTPPASPAHPLAQAIEAIGGEANAVTTREYTALQAVVLSRDVEVAVHRCADLLAPGPLDPAVVERERRIILEEIALASDSYQIIWDLFLQALWNGDPFALPVTGTRESVSALTTAELTVHRSRYEAANGIVLAAAGEVDHDALVRITETRLGTLRPDALPADRQLPSSPIGRAFIEKDTHHTHLAVGVKATAMGDPRRYAVRLLSIILGHGASSRLHRALRTDRGLVYSVSSVTMSYADRGYLAVYTTCAPENTARVSALILDELTRVQRHGVSHAELLTAQTTYEGSLARNFETVLSLASIIGLEELLTHVEPFADGLARIRNVTADEVQEAAARLLTTEHYAIAAIGRRWEDA